MVGLPGIPPVGGGLGGGAPSLGQGLAGLASPGISLVLTGFVGLVSDGAGFVLHETGRVLAETTAPRLTSTWFSATYWRVAGVASVLTLPFLFAAALQALVRSELAVLVRAALGYLPLAMLAIAIATPLTTLLLAVSDQLAAAISSAAGDQGWSSLGSVVGPLGAVSAFSGSPFVAFLVALFTVAAGLALWIELLMREAAVYVIVLMLPLIFSAFVWPARRIWAIRAVELLVALILSKFAIVAVLSLGAAALGHSAGGSLAGVLAGMVLLVLGAFAPWALLRLLPLAELASGAAGALRGHAGTALGALREADGWATEAQRLTAAIAHVRRARDVGQQPSTRTPAEVERTDAAAADVPDTEPALHAPVDELGTPAPTRDAPEPPPVDAPGAPTTTGNEPEPPPPQWALNAPTLEWDSLGTRPPSRRGE